MTVQIRRVSHAAIVGESERSRFMPSFSLHVNGQMLHVDVDDPDMPLIYALRDILKLKGPRFGCGLAQCGACTVHIDREPTRDCVTPLSAVGAGKIVTLEGLGTPV